MATLEEALNAAEVAQTNEEWTKLPDYKEKDVYSDMDYTVDLQNKTIQSLEDNVSTFGEQNSQYISFMLDRFYDGVDLKDMRFRVQYELDDGVGSVDNLVNGYYNEEYLKFGWIVPIEATQLSGTIKVMLFCTGTLLEEDYILKTKPIEYTIHNTLPIGGGIPKPDENWFLSFITDMDEKVATAHGYADSANQASQDAEQLKLSVDESKAHIDTVAAQVEENAEQSSTDAQSAATSATAAKESEEKAKQYVDNVLAISPAQVTDAVTVDPSFAGGLKVNQLYGKSEQKQYSGKQQFNINNVVSSKTKGLTISSIVENNLTIGISIVGTLSDNSAYLLVRSKSDGFTFGKGKSYKLTGGAPGANIRVREFDGDGTEITSHVDIGNGVTFTVSEDTSSCDMYIVVYGTYGQNKNLEVYPMVTLSTETNDSFEPYVGGIPSPNPDYPQEIKSVVEPVVKVTGKNLLNATFQTTTQNGVTCTNNGDGTYTLNGTATEDFTEYISNTTFAAGTYKFIGTPPEVNSDNCRCWLGGGATGDDRGSGVSFTISTQKEIGVALYVKGGYTVKNVTFKPMITTDTSVTYDDYEPYREQSVPLTGITLNAIPVSSGGNVTIDGQQYISDYVDVERGKIVRMCGKRILNGLEDWSLAERTETFVGVFVVILMGSKANATALSNKYLHKRNFGVTYTYEFDTLYSQLRFLAQSMNQTLAEWKEYVSKNNITVLYQLATPAEESLSDELAEKLLALKTYAGVTNIFVSSTELPPMVELEYGAGTAGAYVLQALNLAKINELHIAALTAQTTTTEDEGGEIK